VMEVDAFVRHTGAGRYPVALSIAKRLSNYLCHCELSLRKRGNPMFKLTTRLLRRFASRNDSAFLIPPLRHCETPLRRCGNLVFPLI